MTYEAKLKVQFTSKYTLSAYSSYETDSLPEENYTFEVPAEDLNSTQVFGLFRKVMLTMGYDENVIASGMMSTVFNPDGDEKLMRKMCDEYDLTMNEDVGKKVQEEVQKQLEIEKELARVNRGPMGTVPDDVPGTPGSYRKLYQENLELKAKLSRLQNPDAPSYTDEEIDAMSYEDSAEQKYVSRVHDNGVS